MKKWFIMIILLLCCAAFAGCDNKNNSSLQDALLGANQNNVHDILGEPTEQLSGFWGDIYSIENGTNITIYYDDNGDVNRILVTNIDGEQSYLLEGPTWLINMEGTE